MAVLNFVHAGVVVDDLAAAVGFFTELGLECDASITVEGEWLERILAVPGARVEVLGVRTPDGTAALELAKFHSPAADPEAVTEPDPANRPGIRHVAYRVDDVRAVVERMRAAGWGTVGEIVDYEGIYLLCYIRGPEGIIVEVAERLRPESA